mmetsp:Transcript_4901/g.8723  ORF Transcript_4901/g.8723 Transcript_4901/m.8723 type:complete len:106 (-) Transcript_4901:99-416(-)
MTASISSDVCFIASLSYDLILIDQDTADWNFSLINCFFGLSKSKFHEVLLPFCEFNHHDFVCLLVACCSSSSSSSYKEPSSQWQQDGFYPLLKVRIQPLPYTNTS